jgi:hypothetical protein
MARPGPRRGIGMALAFGTTGLLTSAAAVGAAIGSIHHGSGHAPELTVLSLHFSYPRVNLAAGVLFALAAAGLATISIAIRASWGQRRAHREFVGHLSVVGPLAGRPAVTVIADPRPQAFCTGYLRPSIYVSRGTLELLSDPELDAVLAHEHHHSRARDPLRFACGRILSRALFFVPALRALCERDAELAEVSADRAAVEASGGQRAPLAAALLAFDGRGDPGTGGVSPERIDSLLGEPFRRELPWRSAAASLGLLCGIGLTIWRIGEIASAHATLSLPILSSQPCLVITLLALVGWVGVSPGRLLRVGHLNKAPVLVRRALLAIERGDVTGKCEDAPVAVRKHPAVVGRPNRSGLLAKFLPASPGGKARRVTPPNVVYDLAEGWTSRQTGGWERTRPRRSELTRRFAQLRRRPAPHTACRLPARRWDCSVWRRRCLHSRGCSRPGTSRRTRLRTRSRSWARSSATRPRISVLLRS